MKNGGAKGDTYYGKVAANYEKRRAKQGWWKVEQDQMKTLLGELPDGLSVLDVPFGTGRFVPYYIEKQFEISGVDASDEMLKAAEKSLGSQYQKCRATTGNAMSLAFDDNQFDLVVSSRFLRDIIVADDAIRALIEFARVTKKYAILQLGETSDAHATAVEPGFVLGSRLSASGNDEMLREAGLKVRKRALVKSDPDIHSDIYFFLCEKL